ncbi:hypothetical protein [Cellulophaga baltica]|uniref:hypothetical protein n=1 Tax=Cellulophaga baltica TaxID=76594 RepID=UPI002495061B|nr:hypothetical protein [Cellulophaga baltica]
MNIKFTLLFLLVPVLSIGQENDSDEIDEIEFAEKLTYSFSSEIFKDKAYETDLDHDYTMPWKKTLYTEEQIEQALDTLIKNASIKIEKGSFSNHVLRFNSYFPEFIDEGLMEYFDLSIKKSTIINRGVNLEIQESGSSGYGSQSSSGYENGISFSHLWRTLNTSFNIKTTVTTEEYKGAVVFKSGFINSYNYLKISSADIGKKMSIGGHEFTVVDIIHNSVILDFGVDAEDLELKFVNLNQKGERFISSGSTFSSQTLFEDTYKLFKNNPKLTFEAYKKEFHTRYVALIENAEKNTEVEENIFGKKYRVFTASGKLMNAYLYEPKYTSKEFKIIWEENPIEHTPKAPKVIPTESNPMLQFRTENEDAVLIGDTIALLDTDLNLIKTIETGVFVKSLGITSTFYNKKKLDETCDGYKYIKIAYEGKEYVVAGKNVFKLKKLEIQAQENGSDIEFFSASSTDDYLQNILPGAGFNFCEHTTFSPIIIHNVKSGKYSFIALIEEGDVYHEISSELKKANFFQSETSLKSIELVKNGFTLDFKDNLASFKVLVMQKNNSFTAKYIE